MWQNTFKVLHLKVEKFIIIPLIRYYCIILYIVLVKLILNCVYLLSTITPIDHFYSVVQSLLEQKQSKSAASQPTPGGVASGLAIVDPLDTYLALVT